MKEYNVLLCEVSGYRDKTHYSIQILPSSWNEVGVRYAKKEYTDEQTYRRDVEQDFKNLSPDGNAMLSDERAKYYGWPVTTVEEPAHSAPKI